MNDRPQIAWLKNGDCFLIKDNMRSVVIDSITKVVEYCDIKHKAKGIGRSAELPPDKNQKCVFLCG